MIAARLLKGARRRAGLTQRQLAARAGLPHVTVARIEAGRVDPRVGTLVTLLRACGADLEAVAALGQGVDQAHIRANLALTPTERLERVAAEAQALDALRGAARRR